MNYVIDYEDKKAFTEVYDILMFLDEKERKKIPDKFIEFLKCNRLENYITKINPYIPLEIQKISNQSRTIIACIYRKYLADEDEKEEFRKKDYQEYEKERKIIEKNYNNMFIKTKNADNENTKKEEIKETSNLPIVKMSFFERIKNRIKKIFKMRF